MNHPLKWPAWASEGKALPTDPGRAKRTPKSALLAASANTEPPGTIPGPVKPPKASHVTNVRPEPGLSFIHDEHPFQNAAEFEFMPSVPRAEIVPFPVSLAPGVADFTRPALFPAAEP